MSSHLSCLLFYTTFHLCISLLNVQNNTSVLKKKGNLDRMQCEKLLGLAGRNTKKRGNKIYGECITPIRYNILMNMYRYSVDTLH